MAWVHNDLGLLPSPWAAHASLHPTSAGGRVAQERSQPWQKPCPCTSAEVLRAESKLQQHVMLHAAADDKE